ncbi:type II secretion system protein GspL, partial [Xanthomonas citri]
MTTTLLLLPADAAAESIAVRADAQGQVQSVGHATAPPEPSARALLVVPGVDVHLRWLRLPGRSMAQSRAAARLQLAEHLAIETQALHVVIAGSAEADGTRLVAAVDSVVMQQWLARATQLGFAPDAVVPDCLLLEPGADATAAVMHWDGRWLIRGAQLACSLEPEAARLLLGDRVPAVPPGPDPTHSIAGFARSAAHVPIDLLQHPFANKAAAEQKRAPRRLAVLAALVLLSPVLLLLAQTLRYEIGARVLQARTATQLGVHDAAAVPAALQARRQAG